MKSRTKVLVAETLDWDEEEVFNDEEVTQVKVLMALADDELIVRKSHACNGEWVDITIRKVNTLLSMDEDVDCEQIPHQKKKVLGGELFTESLSKNDENENRFIPASMRILVPKSQVVNESLESTKTSNAPESSKDSKPESLTHPPPLKTLLGASPSSDVMPLTFKPHSPREKPDLVPTEVKYTEQESKINKLTKLVQMLIDEKVNSAQKTQESNSQIQQTNSSKSVDSSKISQDSKPKAHNAGSSKSLRPKPIQKPQIKCELCHYTNYLIDDCYRIL
uniref:Retrovirus-related Pol polyprotein from transposon TNT 1-94 n=1 Tax=Tanacetum cinerariifolium TaxID=118510 RepID=A0A699KSX8_TANCI|nr:retrovirus-related Pol polyprotein from transposon TNT 1-94 [Tanacetum cinerariifolium]